MDLYNPFIYLVLKIFGIVTIKFDQNSLGYKKSLPLTIYSICFTITLQTFNGFCFYYREFLSNRSIIERNPTSWLMKIIIWLDLFIWVSINCFLMFRIPFIPNSFCDLPNNFTKKVSHANYVLKLYTIIPIVGIPISGYLHYGFSKFGICMVFSLYCFVCQFLGAHLFEFYLFDKVKEHFKILRNEIRLAKSNTPIELMLETFEKYARYVKILEKTFAPNMVVGLGAAFVLLTFFWFYGLAYFIEGSVKKYAYFWYHSSLVEIMNLIPL